MNIKEVQAKLAGLESRYDQLEKELHHLDELLREVGFSNGIASIKQAAIEILETPMPDEN